MKFAPLAAFLLPACLFLSGCGHDPHGLPENENTPRHGRGGPKVEPIHLAGERLFFGGELLARISLSNRPLQVAKGDSSQDKSRNAAGPSGPGGGMGRGGGGPGPGSMGGMPPGDREGPPGDMGARRGPGMQSSHLPPMSLLLELTNQTDKPLVVTVWELSSELGNFAVRPDTLTVPPHETVSPSPMTSYLGLRSGQVPTTLDLRAKGQEEKAVLVLAPSEPPKTKEAPSSSP